MKDFLEQLAELEVREPPPEFDRQFHQRLNRSLTVQHLVDLVLGAIPWTLMQFVRPLGGLLVFTLRGTYGAARRPEDKDPGAAKP